MEVLVIIAGYAVFCHKYRNNFAPGFPCYDFGTSFTRM
jgi:hypothetical protein